MRWRLCRQSPRSSEARFIPARRPTWPISRASMNTYYSNLIEGHNTRPRDIERALEGKFDQDKERRNLQVEAAAHVHLQAEIDQMAREGKLPEPASRDFILRLHRDFYKYAPP